MVIPPGLKIKVNLVVFALLAVGLILAMATQVLSVLEDRYSVFATFPDAGGVFTNQEVTYRGMTVGQVGAMEVVREGVRIELTIAKRYQIPAEDIHARVMFKSAVGEQFVDLLPESNDAPFLEDGDEIPMEQTSIPVSTQELLATLEAVLRGVPPDALERTVDSLGEGLGGLGPDLSLLLESSADLATIFAERAPEVEGILRGGTTVGDAFLSSSRDFATAMEQLVTVSESLASSRGDLRRLLVGSSHASDEVVALLRARRAELNRLIVKLADLNEIQAEERDHVAELFRSLPKALNRVVRAFEKDTGLIRFGLVNDPEAHACSYGTERRQPPDRSERKIPKRASCGGGDAPGGRSRGTPAPTVQEESKPESDLPARMSKWSWSLFYLNGM